MHTIANMLVILFLAVQLAYLCSMLIDVYFFTRPVNRVDMNKVASIKPADHPYIVLFYPVLRESEATMATTMASLAAIDYPRDRYSVVAIPNENDNATIAGLHRLQEQHSFLQVLPVPPTTDQTWDVVWNDWESNAKAYWFHNGPRAGNRDLPPKKTRQLIYAFYNVASQRNEPFLVNYIDADSAPPRDHFLAAVAGMQDYDVLQARNVAGNLLHNMASTMFALDHLIWDANKYGHLTADGKQPYWVLGKGLFFKSSDLIELGGFHPWITIEDPEVGMRFWKNGRKLGLIDAPLIEEVPETFGRGLTQRKRWVAGFFQSLNVPLKEMGFTRSERIKAWLNFLPCLSLSLNAVGIPLGIWAIVVWALGRSPLPTWSLILAGVNITLFVIGLVRTYVSAWRNAKVVKPSAGQRLWYLIRINPLVLFVYWLWWLIPLWVGWRMYRKDGGLVWERTEKTNAIETEVRTRLQQQR